MLAANPSHPPARLASLENHYSIWGSWNIVENEYRSMMYTDGTPCSGLLRRKIEVHAGDDAGARSTPPYVRASANNARMCETVYFSCAKIRWI